MKKARKKVDRGIDSWFNKYEMDVIRLAKERAERIRNEKLSKEKEKLKKLHWMKCPKCGHDMEVNKIKKIEVDRCKTCEGIFLDAGELDALLLKNAKKRRSFFRKLASPILSEES